MEEEQGGERGDVASSRIGEETQISPFFFLLISFAFSFLFFLFFFLHFFRFSSSIAFHSLLLPLPCPDQSQYLRFKRRHQTVFLHCEPQELLGAVKLRLAAILAVDEEDIRFYEFMSPERKAHVLSILEEKLKEAHKLRKKKPGEPKPNIEEEMKLIEIPPLPDTKKLWELGLENDSVVFFVYRTHPMTDWDEWEYVDVPGLQPGNGKLLGQSANQIPGGDGFGEPGSAALRAAQQAEEEAAAQRRAQAAKDEEQRMLLSAPPPAESAAAQPQ